MKPHQATIILSTALAALLILSGVGYTFAARFLSRQTSLIQDQLTQTAQADADLTALAETRASYTKTIAPVADLIDAALPQSKQQTEILAQLQHIAAATGLIITSISLPTPTGLPSSTSQTVAVSGVLAQPISFQLTGSYGQLQNFLTQVESLNRSTSVTTLSVSRPDASKPITYAITLNAYSKP